MIFTVLKLVEYVFFHNINKERLFGLHSGELISAKESKLRAKKYTAERRGSFIFDGIKDIQGNNLRWENLKLHNFLKRISSLKKDLYS